MAGKKITQLDTRIPTTADLLIIGDPSSGYSYKAAISALASLLGGITSITATGPLTGGTITSTGSIGITQSGASSDGYLSSTDWTTFNNKMDGAATLTINGTALTLSTSPSYSLPHYDDGSGNLYYQVSNPPIVSSVYSAILSGQNNSVNGDNSIVVGGDGNTIGCDYGFIGGGYSNQILSSSNYSSIISGETNYISAYTINSSITSGQNNSIGGNLSACFIGGGISNGISDAISSIIVGGEGNLINMGGERSCILGGISHQINSSDSFIGGGAYNYIDSFSQYAVICGGYENSIQGNNCVILGGYQNRVGKQLGSIVGGQDGLTNTRGQRAYAVGKFSSQGDAQQCDYVFKGITTNNTQTQLNTGDDRIYISPGQTICGTIKVVGYHASASQTRCTFFHKRFVVQCTLAGTITIPQDQTIGTNHNPNGYNVILSFNAATFEVRVLITGDATLQIKWMAHLETLEFFGTV